MDKFEQKLANVFANSWNDTAPIYSPVNMPLELADLRELASSEMKSALAVAGTWSGAFEIKCTGDASGVLVCLLKSDDLQEFEALIKHSEDGKSNSGTRTLLNEIFKRASTTFEEDDTLKINFGKALFFDLTNDSERLAKTLGDSAWLGTYSLKIDEMESQMLLAYAVNSPKFSKVSEVSNVSDIQGSSNISNASGESVNETISSFGNQAQFVEEPSQPKFSVDDKRVKHLERLLDVELDIVVRFGVTNLPLRDVVHLGVGTMLELNRMVDAPVEILVNGRHLANGEVVVIDGYYGVRITSIGTQNERVLSLI